MIRNAIWIIVSLFLTISSASDCTYQKAYFKSGKPYLKINIGDSTQWIGITNYRLEDTLICCDNESQYKEILRILNDNEISSLNTVNDCRFYGISGVNKQLISAEQKKYYFGIYSFLIGFVSSAAAILMIDTFFL
jgi:hypothetical protein